MAMRKNSFGSQSPVFRWFFALFLVCMSVCFFPKILTKIGLLKRKFIFGSPGRTLQEILVLGRI